MRVTLRHLIGRPRGQRPATGVLGLSGPVNTIAVGRKDPPVGTDVESRYRIGFLAATPPMAHAVGVEEVSAPWRAAAEPPEPARAPAQRATAGLWTLPRPADDALRLALQLQAVTWAGPARMLLFAPVSRGHSPARLVREAALALVHLGEGPALIIDLRQHPWSPADLAHLDIFGRRELEDLRSRPPFGSLDPPGKLALEVLCLREGAETIPPVESTEFRTMLGDLRRRFPSILCLGGPVTQSVESLLVGSLSDATVLSVVPGRTTIASVRAAREELRRVSARILGFVLDGSVGRRSVEGAEQDG